MTRNRALLTAALIATAAAPCRAQTRGAAPQPAVRPFLPVPAVSAVGREWGNLPPMLSRLADAGSPDAKLARALSQIDPSDAASRRTLAPLVAALAESGVTPEHLESATGEAELRAALDRAVSIAAREAETAAQLAERESVAEVAQGAYVLEALLSSAKPYLEAAESANSRGVVAALAAARRRARTRLDGLRSEAAVAASRMWEALPEGPPLSAPSSNGFIDESGIIGDLRRSSPDRTRKILSKLDASSGLFDLYIAQGIGAELAASKDPKKRDALARFLARKASSTLDPEARRAALGGLLQASAMRTLAAPPRDSGTLTLRAARSAAASGDTVAMAVTAQELLRRVSDPRNDPHVLWRAVDRLGTAAGGLGALAVPGMPPAVPTTHVSSGLIDERLQSSPRFWGAPVSRPADPGWVGKLLAGMDSHPAFGVVMIGVLGGAVLAWTLPPFLLGALILASGGVAVSALWHHHPIAGLAQYISLWFTAGLLASPVASGGTFAALILAAGFAGFTALARYLHQSHRPFAGTLLALLWAPLLIGLFILLRI